ncbi:MAG: hypothetical protein P4L81_05010 [Candidatus Pacebacteria bacterium]|nr:hypothetical protein [Candidatus Paceibacterota bacterium]
MPYEDQIVRIERKGGQQRTSFPHICPFRENGAEKDACADFTRLYQRNLQGCCGSNCNSALRLCRKCLELHVSDPKKVVNPVLGLCELHQGDRPITTSQPVQQGLSWLRTRLEDREVNKMPSSTNEECARLKELSGGERQVLHWFAYGYDETYVNRELAKKNYGVRSAAEALPIVFRKLRLGHIERERDRLIKAGKILLDYNERERNEKFKLAAKQSDDPNASFELDDESLEEDADELSLSHEHEREKQSVEFAVTLEEQPRESAGATIREISTSAATLNTKLHAAPAVDETTLPAHADAQESEATTEKESIPMDNDELQEAKKIVSRYAEAKSSGEEYPHVSEVLTAAMTLSQNGETRTAIGEAFGYGGSSGATWATNILKLNNLTQSAWKALGAQHLPISFLFGLADLSSADQVAAIKERLTKREKKSPKPEKPAAKLEKQVAKASHEQPMPASMPAHAEDVAPAIRHSNGNGSNGQSHQLAELLPVHISLVGLGRFVDIDLVSLKLGPEAAPQRAAAIAARRESGYEAAEIVIHPAMTPQMIFLKRE